MNADLIFMANVRSLIEAGWCIEMDTGLRGGELRSWVTLRHWEKGARHKVRSAQGDLDFALQSAMMLAGVEYWRGPSTNVQPSQGECDGR